MARLDAKQLRHYCEQVHLQAQQQFAELPKEKAVHQLRLCTKRLRAAWQLLAWEQPILSKQRQRQLNLMAKQLASQRDLDVRRNWLKKLCPAALELLTHSQQTEHQRLSSLEQGVLQQQLQLDREAWQEQPLEKLEEGLACTRRKGRKLCQKLETTSSAPEYHRLRKWAKYLQYQQEIQGEPNPNISQLTKTLGDKHDLDLLLEWLATQSCQNSQRLKVLEQRLSEPPQRSKKQHHRREQLRELKQQRRLLRLAQKTIAGEEKKLAKQAHQQAHALYQPSAKSSDPKAANSKATDKSESTHKQTKKKSEANNGK